MLIRSNAHWLFLIFDYCNCSCPKDTCTECIDIFEGWKFVQFYECEAECELCSVCNDPDSDYSTTVAKCKYCVDGEENCKGLCAEGKATCTACEGPCKA